ncbi:CocE/NonD family hydrolase [Myceligenerans cantabricum]
MRVRKAAAAAAGVLIGTTAFVTPAVAETSEPASQGVPPGSVSPSDSDPVTHDDNPRVPEGAAWTQHYFPSTDGVELHADVLRPADLPEDEQTPVILSVGPYFSHAGQTGNDGFDVAGPSERFDDFLEGGDVLAEGYTWVMVDLRGFGGSTGCLDWVGPGEQADVAAAIEWSASQDWSDGNVGMYGKSYDASTGLAGNGLDLPALKAVVAQEPVWDMYNYLYSNEVPRPNVRGTPQAYNSIATIAPMADDDARYRENAQYEDNHPECLSDNLSNNQDPDPTSDYWVARDLATLAEGTDTPLFVTQGFIEPNTKPEDVQQYLENHEGPQRSWLGQWDHVRGNDTVSDGRLAMGREGWFDEVMRFYDEYLKGAEPSVEDPAHVLEDSEAAWRGQAVWPVVDRTVPVSLPDGTFVDDGGRAAASPSVTSADGWDMENAPPAPGLTSADELAAREGAERAPGTLAAAATSTYLVWSEPVDGATRVTGTPSVGLTASAPGNVMVRLFDVAPDGSAVMFDENVARLATGDTSFDLKSTDWTLRDGHSLAVQVGSIVSGGWSDRPSGETIEVSGAVLELALDDPSDDAATDGERSPYLDRYLANNSTTFDEPGEPSFDLNP